jgi:hypothetical protein
LLTAKEREEELIWAQKRICQVNTAWICAIGLICLFLALTTTLFLQKSTQYLNMSNAASLNYTNHLGILNNSTVYNGKVVSDTIASSYKSTWLSLMGIAMLSIALLPLLMLFFISFFSLSQDDTPFEIEHKLMQIKLKSENIIRICDYCEEGIQHSRFTHNMNMLKTEFCGERHWIAVREISKLLDDK